MMQIVGLFMCVVGIAWGQNSTCDDIDPDVCRTFNTQVNVCADPCLSKLCPRTCNTCPRKCYSCNGVTSLNDCNATQICPDKNHDCFVYKGLTSSLSIIYNLGCAEKDVCSNLFVSHLTTTPPPSTTTTQRVIKYVTIPYVNIDAASAVTGGSSFLVGRRKRHGLNGNCCKSDLCNKYEPSKRKRQMTSSLSVASTTVPTQTSSLAPGCSDIDTLSCQKLAHLKKDLCSDACLVKACPRTCGKCSECYTCNFVQSPENCTVTSVCLPAEKCYAVEEYLDNGNHGYRLGCLHENVCQRFHRNGGKVFGRRSDHVALTLDGDCCSGDLCNHRPLVHVVPTTTHAPIQTTHHLTTTPPAGCSYTPGHHCPNGFHIVDGKCLIIGTTQVSHNVAKRNCQHHCSRLMENISMRDAENIRFLMEQVIPNVPHDRRLLTVGIHTEHHHLVWDYAGHPVPGFHNVRDNACVVLPFDFHHQDYLRMVDCSDHNYFICEAQFRN